MVGDGDRHQRQHEQARRGRSGELAAGRDRHPPGKEAVDEDEGDGEQCQPDRPDDGEPRGAGARQLVVERVLE